LIIIESFMGRRYGSTLGRAQADHVKRRREAHLLSFIRRADEQPGGSVRCRAMSRAATASRDAARRRTGQSDAASGSLHVDDVTKRFGGTTVLHGVSLVVHPGSVCALLGPSGSGKTTLLRVVAGLEQPDGGTIALGDHVLHGPGVDVPPERRRIGMVFQDWALFPHLTVAQNVGFGLGRRADPAKVATALAMVGLAAEAGRLPGTLSGGQQQRVALARALAPRPDVLLLDEPFSNLDVALRARLRREVHDLLRAAGVTTVFVTHDQDEAFVLGDHVAVMRDGRIEQVAPPAELYLRPRTPWVAGFVGDANLIAGVADGDIATTALGTIALSRPAHGDVDVLVRPEQLAVERGGRAADDALDDSTASRVTFVEYYGHDAMFSITHGALGELRARAIGSTAIGEGDAVRVRLVGGHTVAFPAAAPSTTASPATDSPPASSTR
jgi:iron(III) transport system ATP-binding protein